MPTVAVASNADTAALISADLLVASSVDLSTTASKRSSNPQKAKESTAAFNQDNMSNSIKTKNSLADVGHEGKSRTPPRQNKQRSPSAKGIILIPNASYIIYFICTAVILISAIPVLLLGTKLFV